MFLGSLGQAFAADELISTKGDWHYGKGSALNGTLAAWTELPTGLNVTSFRLEFSVRLNGQPPSVSLIIISTTMLMVRADD